MPYSAMNSNPGAGGFNATVVVEADCGIFALIQTTEELQSLFWRIDDALIFSPWIRTHADAAAARLRNMSRARGVADGRFNALHIRAEKDWVEHCHTGLGGIIPTACATQTSSTACWPSRVWRRAHHSTW